jgi:hypothetical protein
MGHDVEIINYKNLKHFKNEMRYFLLKKNPFEIFLNLKKIYSFSKDVQRFNLNPKRLTFSSKKIDFLRYDSIIVGADIVWNYEMPLLGSDPIYFGHGIPDSVNLIAYAPSCGAVNKDKGIKDYVLSGLKKFKNISVRDENSALVVDAVLGYKPPIFLDPTFLYNFYGEEVIVRDEDYILVYAYSLTEEEKVDLLFFSQSKNLKIIAIAYSQTWADINVVNVSPFEWLGYIKRANYVFTSTFHGSIFCIKYNKVFAISMNEAIKNKVQTLLDKFDLHSRELTPENRISDTFSSVTDFTFANQVIEKEKQICIEYIKDSLSC